MSLDELVYVRHMLDEARYLEGAAATLERAAFLASSCVIGCPSTANSIGNRLSRDDGSR